MSVFAPKFLYKSPGGLRQNKPIIGLSVWGLLWNPSKLNLKPASGLYFAKYYSSMISEYGSLIIFLSIHCFASPTLFILVTIPFSNSSFVGWVFALDFCISLSLSYFFLWATAFTMIFNNST